MGFFKGLTFETLFATTATAMCGYLGGWDAALRALAWFIFIDYLTGFLGAWKQRKVDSEIMFWGGIRKGAVFLVVGIAVMLDGLVGNNQPIFRTMAIYYYVAREGISVIENLGVLNVPIPPFLSKALVQIQDKNSNAETKDATKRA